MRLSISNIAWEPDEDDAVGERLAERGVGLIDIAPVKYFAAFDATRDVDIDRVKAAWANYGVEIYGMQALLAGTQGFNLFTDDGAMLEHLKSVSRLAGRLGVGPITFGSPKNRDRGQLSDAETHRIATDFFRRLGDVAGPAGVTVCLEPNPAGYGGNFMLTSRETAAVVRAIDHEAIRMQLDVGSLAMTGEAADEIIDEAADIIGHVHASEPHLVTIGEAGAPHYEAAAALRRRRPDLAVTIEMVKTEGPQAERIGRVIDTVIAIYGDLA